MTSTRPARQSSDLTSKVAAIKAEADTEQHSSPSPQPPASDLDVPSSADKMDITETSSDVQPAGSSRRRTQRSKPSPPSSASQHTEDDTGKAVKPKRERRSVKQEPVKQESPEPVAPAAADEVDLTKCPTDAENKPLPADPRQRTDGVEGTDYYW